MASTNTQSQQAPNNLDRYVVIHVATTCDEHGVYVTKDSAEVIELGWILLDAKTCEEVTHFPLTPHWLTLNLSHTQLYPLLGSRLTLCCSFTAKTSWSSQ
jgi:hypothetical protein